MFDKSIAYKLSVFISLAVVGVFITFIILTFLFNNKQVTANIENTAKTESSNVILDVKRQLISTQEISLNAAEQTLYYADNDDVQFLLTMLMTKYPFLNAIHVNIDSTVTSVKTHYYFMYRDSDSLLFDSGNSRIFGCPLEERIFDDISKNEVPDWTEVFSCERNENMVASFYSPVINDKKHRNSKPVGSVICELSLKSLNDSINGIHLKGKGYAFLVSQDGTYLTHPEKDWILNKNLYDIADKSYNKNNLDIKDILNSRHTGTAFFYPEFLNYERSWVYFTPIVETGWTLLVVVPQTELYKPLYLMILRMLFFSVLGILIIFYIVTLIAKRLIQPLNTVTTQLKKFSTISGETGHETMNEITMLSESLDYLQSWYEKFQIDQNKEEKLNYQRRQDLLEASEIQLSLIKTDFSAFENRKDVDLYALYKPARIVSGDLFDYYFIDNDHLFFSIGDVSGKGISAAFFMSVAQTIIKNNINLKKPGELVTRVNNDLYTANHHQFFLTLFAGILNLKNKKLTYCNAAHTSTVILNSNNDKIIELGHTHGLPLGLYPGKKYKDTTIELKAEDSIIAFTDGVIELQNNNNEIFRLDRFHERLKILSQFAPWNLVTHIDNDLEEFKGNAKQVDDITIMAIKLLQ